jgi:hypothetical protein
MFPAAAGADVDCQQTSTKAMTLLMTFKRDALNNQHPDSAKFKAEFAPLVNAMQQGHCLNELMGMMQFVQNEQKTYASPSGGSPAR